MFGNAFIDCQFNYAPCILCMHMHMDVLQKSIAFESAENSS